jgi:hypothetical protein
MSERQNPTQDENIPVQLLARAGGALYLVIIVIGLLGEGVIRSSLIVSGNAAATAKRILASEFLWRLGVAGQIVLLICAIALMLVFYLLLRPVNRNLALLAVFFGLVSLAVESVSALFLQQVLAPLTGSLYAQAADPQPLHALAYLSIRAHANAFGLALVFFGVECIIVGYLIRKSIYFPATIGWLMQLAGLCYLINSFSMVLSPPLQGLISPAILLPSLVGESAFCVWLLIKGVNTPAWERSTRTRSMQTATA